MSVTTCPNGHQSTSTDYCDTCGAPIGGPAATGSPASAGAGGAAGGDGGPAGAGPAAAGASGAATAALSTPQRCPNCGTDNVADALFCEACGYDFTTGAMPRPVAPPSALDLGGPAGPVGATSAPHAATTGPSEPAPLAPSVPLEWVVEVWVDPDWYALQDSDEPCPSPGLPVVVPLTVRSVLVGRASRSRNIHPEIDCTPDVGVSRRHAQLTTDGTRWWIEDLQSSNGTFVGSDSGPLPTQPLTPGNRQELTEGDRVYVGAWTRLVVRRATAEEKAAHG